VLPIKIAYMSKLTLYEAKYEMLPKVILIIVQIHQQVFKKLIPSILSKTIFYNLLLYASY